MDGLRHNWRKPKEFTQNKHGYKGVYYDKPRNSYRGMVTLREAGGRGMPRKTYKSSRFKTAIEAAQAYDELAIQIFGDRAVLNFPLNGEGKAVLAARDRPGNCIRGHKLTLTADGDWSCQICNRAAVSRYKQRKIAAGTWKTKAT